MSSGLVGREAGLGSVTVPLFLVCWRWYLVISSEVVGKVLVQLLGDLMVEEVVGVVGDLWYWVEDAMAI